MEQQKAEIKKQLISSFYHKNHLAISVEIVVAIFSGVMGVLVSWLTQELMDAAALSENARPFSQLVCITGALILIFLGFQLFDYQAKPRFVRRAMRQYKDLAFQKMTEKNISSFRMENTSTYLSAFSNDANTIESAYLCGTMEIINQFANFVCALALMLWYSPLMTLIAVGISILPLAASIITGNRMGPAERKVSERNADYTATLSDCLNGFAVVKSFLAENEIGSLFRKKNQELEQDKFIRFRVLSLVGMIGLTTGTMAQ